VDDEKPDRGPYIHWRDMPPDVRKHELGVWATIIGGMLFYVFWIVADDAPFWVTVGALAGPPFLYAVLIAVLLAWDRFKARTSGPRSSAKEQSGRASN
jgi:hypothetical protein